MRLRNILATGRKKEEKYAVIANAVTAFQSDDYEMKKKVAFLKKRLYSKWVNFPVLANLCYFLIAGEESEQNTIGFMW